MDGAKCFIRKGCAFEDTKFDKDKTREYMLHVDMEVAAILQRQGYAGFAKWNPVLGRYSYLDVDGTANLSQGRNN